MERRPNFLIIQADQLTARALAAYGNRIVKAPNIDRLARNGVVFERAYCNYPLCAPSRFSMLAGRLASRIGAYDNGAEFPASVPTFAHYLRILGYQTCLAGKMHFIGPDQLHGFEERLTTDIYPSDFNWTANWDDASSDSTGGRLLAAAGEAQGVRAAGIYERTVQLDFDDEVAFRAVRKIHDHARGDDQRPFCLFVSFTHPHDPFAIPRRYWDRYRHEDIDLPKVPALARDRLDPHSQRLYDHIAVAAAGLTEAQVKLARHAYYGAISYIDDRIGDLLTALDTAGLSQETVVVFLSDHGEALGERGLWFKRSFFEPAMRIPLIFNAPQRFAARRCNRTVSLVDLFPTLIDLADPQSNNGAIATGTDGHSLRALLLGQTHAWPNLAFAEMTCEGTSAPCLMVVEGSLKYIHCETDPPLLYDLDADPFERENLAGHPAHAESLRQLHDRLERTWNVAALTQAVVDSQRRRRIVDRANAVGTVTTWDYAGRAPSHDRYFRPSPVNPSASNYNDDFQVRLRPDTARPARRTYPP
ncbi:MAG: choline-sulfatase [Proteobacteria bacterium]|nr:choline-sulfatase [Pseudomonadota bacterium]MBI3497291.1 choline-sulfatase [Pseudomonadota bacterium]